MSAIEDQMLVSWLEKCFMFEIEFEGLCDPIVRVLDPESLSPSPHGFDSETELGFL